ncbi:DUF2303 family protein [Streptomyces malaysiensis]|uniref:DUF2303 family protein n=1 Tax=Streptomyces malaysiensis TaxID=92644 RepID=UPI0011CE22B7|nr:YfdQ family protein [Streptomyces malaysiensis]
MTTIDNAQTIANLALRTAPPVALDLGKVHAFHTPSGVHTVDLTGDKHRDTPARKTGTTTVRDATSFLAYYEKHHDDATEVYADADRLTITAVLDAHQTDAARWGQHRLHLALRKTDAWQQWMVSDGQLMKQDEFAEFLEDHLPELLEPAAATMLEIAQSIQGATKAEFQSGTRLQTGERQFKFVETVSAKAGQKGELTIPEQFTIGLVPFEGSEGYRLTARLRYRIESGGSLRMGYKLERPADILRTAFGDVREGIEEQLATAVMNGTPA